MEQNDLDHNLDYIDLDHDQNDALFTGDIPCSIKQSTLFIVQSLLHSNTSNIRIKIIQIEMVCLHGTKFLNQDCNLDHVPDNFAQLNGVYYN